MNLSIIGLGKLGLCTAACFAKAGYQVKGMDVCERHINKIQSGMLPFEEFGLENLIKETKKTLSVTTDIKKAVGDADVTFIIVPTPSEDNGAFSNSYINTVLREIAPVIKEKERFHVIDIVSTVMPGSCENEFIPYLEEKTGKKAGEGFGFAYNPEFIAIGSVIHNFLNPDLVLIGVSDPSTGKILENIYSKTCENSPYIASTSLINAEITKLAINCYCTMKISFANQLGSICDKVPGASASEITAIIGKDTRIGSKYIKPGLGFGGPCFPRDNEAFIQFINDIGEYSGLQEAVVKINNRKTQQAVEKILKATELVGKKVAILGLSYKPDTYLTERSQSIDIATALADSGQIPELRAYDPMARMNGKWYLADTIHECVKDANVVAILTPWPEFFNNGWQEYMSVDRVVLNFGNSTQKIMKLVSPAEAYWNQKCHIADLKDRFDLLSNTIGFENDLSSYQWAQIASFVLAYQPDLIIELGRKHGNSTCLFTEVAKHLPCCRVQSICWSNDFENHTLPKLLEKKIIDHQWLSHLECITADITEYNYEEAFSRYHRILVFWDAHGFEVAACVLGKILPLLEKKEHYILIHDLSDQRFMCDDLYRYNGQQLWHGDSHSGERLVLGHINSAVAQAVSIYDFCSRNRIWIESADYTFHEMFKDEKKMEEMKKVLGDRYFSLQGHWFFLSLNEHTGPFTYPAWEPKK